MVKPIFKTLNDMKAATTAEQASTIGLAFLSSDAAKQDDPSRAGTFAKALPAIFEKFKAPEVFNAFLEAATSPDSKASFGLRTALGFAKTDFRAAIGYQEEASRIILNNAIILKGLSEPKPDGFKFAKHYGDGGQTPESTIVQPYPELLCAKDTDQLLKNIEETLKKADITGEEVPVFFEALMGALQKRDVPIDGQIEILDALQFMDVDQGLRTLAFNKATTLNDQAKAQSQISALPTPYVGGRDIAP